MTDWKAEQSRYASLGRLVEQLAAPNDTQAPVLLEWLLDGPLTLAQLIERRVDALTAKGDPADVAAHYAPLSVLHDLGKVNNFIEVDRNGVMSLVEGLRPAVELFHACRRFRPWGGV